MDRGLDSDPMHMFPQLITFFFLRWHSDENQILTIVNVLMVPQCVMSS